MSNNSSNVYVEVKKNGINDVKEGVIYSDVKLKKGSVFWFLKIWKININLIFFK